MPICRSLAIAAAGVLISSAAAGPVIFNVPGDFATIQQAIDHADSGYVILVAPGTYYENILLTHSITVRSAGGPEVTTIDGQGQTVVRAVGAPPFSFPTAVLEGFTLTGGGGEPLAVSVEIGSLTMSDCIVRDNVGSFGAVMQVVDGDATVSDCVFRDNAAGGIMGVADSTGLITDSIFSGNTGYYGVLAIWSSVDIDGCTFEGNTASGHGGVEFEDTYSSYHYSITNSAFRGNDAYEGGGVNVRSSNPVMITSCTFDGNSAGIGGGVSVSSGGVAVITGCTFSENVAQESGGAIHTGTGIPIVTDSQFCGNVPDHIDFGFADGGGNVFADACEEPCPADVAPPGGDGMVSSSDLLALLGSWRATGPADVNGDGIVNALDLLILLAAWGPCPARA